ncbi:MFS general substrate transporter [Hesseltinella vesiculosa]|uniref:MFS general substrate transporter n=1 Tax=Hesseltinella vesiculosa TaxID=101127 RepID=A0A1X2GX81_9FUNG|nr:MFS general substrate transporter [Hesseltinella vesiculosa]
MSQDEKDSVIGEKQDMPLPPDGGSEGWSVVFGAACGLFAIYGVNYSWGVFLAYYSSTVYPGHMTQLSWVGSICIGFFFILGPINDWVTRFMGYRYMLLFAMVVGPFALMMASLTNAIWQLYLSQGLLFGISASFVWFSCIGSVQQHFTTKRGLALGATLFGSGVGGLVMTNINVAVMQSLGYRWALRITGFICFVFLGVAATLVKPFPGYQASLAANPTSTLKKHQNLVRKLDFCLLLAVAFITTFGYLVPSFMLPSYAKSLKLNPWVGANLSAIINAVNAVAKPFMGYLGDRVGRLNVFFICTFMAGIMCLAVWTNAHTEAAVWAFAVLYGIFGCGYLTMLATVVPQIAGYEAISEANGLLYFLNLPGYLVGSPVASAIINTSDPPNYRYAAVYAGLLLCVGGLFAFALRIAHGGWNCHRI